MAEAAVLSFSSYLQVLSVGYALISVRFALRRKPNKHTGAVELALLVNLGLERRTHRHFLGTETHKSTTIQHSLRCALSDTSQRSLSQRQSTILHRIFSNIF